ncbi:MULTISPECIES: hypothetical protein [unclassified Paenibacillus]|uniref:YkvI family membrane protein n=1 Tax=unclassified Paenibacillus TaxID=185978 RepID=UPI001C0F73C9|nr:MULTISPECIES: hypothetical protein [unclassified Paenibacillus]MBU5442120.1 hypothetical protein [Paenibacillus sp. MSJ-34]CAH0117563.1 hypothetical protein PAE9249_00022 [Paenibacillus sp. CECT 9249]
MKHVVKVLQIAFTYIGTVVGAGFATGQEILQFFTQYGNWAPLTIIAATLLFIWLGTKVMLLSFDIRAKSYEDLNKHLFGEQGGRWISLFLMIILIGVNSVMLAGAGSLFVEHFNIHYQTGLLFTLFCSYILLSKGIKSILALNSVVVPLMLTFTVLIVLNTMRSPYSHHWITLISDRSWSATWAAPFLYTAFNLAMAQAVLVPVGAAMPNKAVIRWGGWLGGLGIGLMLLAGHFALSAYMPGITQFEIPMGSIAYQLGHIVQFIYLFLIFLEIFTTYVADIFGVTLQIRQRWLPEAHPQWITAGIMLVCYTISQFGFSSLLSILYPLFGLFSLVWLVMIVSKQRKSADPLG